MSKVTLEGLSDLSVSERIQLVQELWDSVAQDPDAVPVTAEQKEELDRRLDDYARNPDAGFTWDEVKARLGK